MAWDTHDNTPHITVLTLISKLFETSSKLIALELSNKRITLLQHAAAMRNAVSAPTTENKIDLANTSTD